MLQATANLLIRSRRILLYYPGPKATYIRGFWPEPITQQTLGDFLNDINYFEEPKQFVNIGLEFPKQQKLNKRVDTKNDTNDSESNEVDEILDLLAQDLPIPPLDYDDVRLQGKQITALAMNAGIFRDLFGKFTPDREHIKFRQEQAERLDALVPYYWITDQPFARVQRHFKEPDPLMYFDPLVGISAKFVHKPQSAESPDELYAHTSYHGNIIPASEAFAKPSITLDGRLLSSDKTGEALGEGKFNNFSPGSVEFVNFKENEDKFYTIALVNLDHLIENTATLHWMLTNIKPNRTGGVTSLEEVCDYLPVHGIRGFGYSRFVFLVFQHDSELDSNSSKVVGFSLDKRRFDATSFLGQHKSSNLVPVGMSWFQTVWDSSSNKVFHDYLKIRAPTYEHVQTKCEMYPEKNYPGRVPFNIFLDRRRSKKSINEQVLLERMKEVDPYNYKDQYVPPKVPPTVFEDENMPSWLKISMFKRKNKIGYWRGLRPASAILPLDNNADLDYPIRPIGSSKKSPPGFPNLYDGRIKYKKFKDLPHSKPQNEHSSVYIEHDNERYVDEVKKIINEFKSVKNSQKASRTSDEKPKAKTQ